MYQVDEKIEMRGVIGQTFIATINGMMTELPINIETKFGIIKQIIPGSSLTKEYSYMIKYMSYSLAIEVDEDYIKKFKCHCACHPCQCHLHHSHYH